MDTARVQRITGLSGVSLGVAVTVSIPLYFVYAGPPPAWNVLTRDFINLFVCALLLVFVVGLSHLIRRADAGCEWLASLVHAAGLSFVGVALVATALEAGVVFGAPDGTLDPTVDGPLANANILLHGSIKRLLTALMLAAAGYAIQATRLLPRWSVWAAYAVALSNLAFVPSLYFGSDVTRFYSAIGWGNSAFVASFLGYWVFAVGIVLWRRPGSADPARQS